MIFDCQISYTIKIILILRRLVYSICNDENHEMPDFPRCFLQI